MQQAFDFKAECAEIHNLLAPLNNAQFNQATLFKGWTINQILRHLHVWNVAADLSLSDAARFAAFLSDMAAGIKGGHLPDFEAAYLDGLSGQALLAAWIDQVEAMTPRFAGADPKARVHWVGPEMSVISSITARLMETWAHGQAVYDILGVDRIDADRIGNIVRLGVNTFGWTYRNRGMAIPDAMPHLQLIAPSGTIWTYGQDSSDERIEGSATEFCQVVTQCRNIADTGLYVTGATATQWMAMAQCFAGPAQHPPKAGMRGRA